MDWLVRVLLVVHLVAGFSSLVFFWLPMFTKKGSRNHVLFGKIYIRLMWLVVGSAAALSVKNVVIGAYAPAAFLGFLALITANPLWFGIAIFKNKKGLSESFKRTHLLFHIAIVFAALGLIIYGVALQGKGPAILMFIFGGLGLGDVPKIIKQLKGVQLYKSWLTEHIVGMITSGIAAYTAFFVFGAGEFFKSLLSGYWTIIPWVAPGILGAIGIRYAVKRYEKKG